MKVVIFAGGLGTRLSEETSFKPKPMVEIGGKPILWHILKIYESQGYSDFIICLGYKGYIIKEYFLNYYVHNSNLTIDLSSNSINLHNKKSESLKITLVETGLHTKTAGRLKRIEDYIENDTFMLTYGDGVSNVNITKLLEFHKHHGKLATMTSIRPPGRFGSVDIIENKVISFEEKPLGDDAWINGGFFVLNKEIFQFLPNDADNIMWEDTPLENIAKENNLMAFKHYGFWKCMDHLRDKKALDDMWATGNASWKTW